MESPFSAISSIPKELESPDSLLPEIDQTDKVSLQKTFSSMMNKVSKEVQAPYQVAQEMATGERPFSSASLIMSIVRAERKMNLTVRILNDLIRGVKTLENIQA